MDLTTRFEKERARLTAIATRILGSAHEADDAVQDTWLRLNAADSDSIVNLQAWLTTTVSRICLDILRKHKSITFSQLDMVTETSALDDEIDLALNVVLNQLSPEQRIAFMLHDVFGYAFVDIARILERTPAATRKLASRARNRVNGERPTTDPVPVAIIEAFLQASRQGDVSTLVRLLADNAVRHQDIATSDSPAGSIRGRRKIVREIVSNTKRARFGTILRINGEVGIVSARRGQPVFALRFESDGERISRIDVIGDPSRLNQLRFSLANSSSLPILSNTSATESNTQVG